MISNLFLQPIFVIVFNFKSDNKTIAYYPSNLTIIHYNINFGKKLTVSVSSYRSFTKTGAQYGPRERSGHRIIYHEGSIYAFGGYNPSLEDDPAMQNDPSWNLSKPLFKELWQFNTFTSRWTKMPMHGNVPSQLASHTATLVDIRGQNPKMMVYGGTGTPYGVITSHSIFMLGKNANTKMWNCLTGKAN